MPQEYGTFFVVSHILRDRLANTLIARFTIQVETPFGSIRHQREVTAGDLLTLAQLIVGVLSATSISAGIPVDPVAGPAAVAEVAAAVGEFPSPPAAPTELPPNDYSPQQPGEVVEEGGMDLPALP